MAGPDRITPPAAVGGMAPLKHTLFAVLWGATILGNIGSFMRDVASAWLVTDLSNNPAAVAMMQTAATLPVFLLAIPAGVLLFDSGPRAFAWLGILAVLGSVLVFLSHYLDD